MAKVKDRAGNYYFYSKEGRLLYVGWSAVLRHRLQSYYQDDDLKVHPTKKVLRQRIAYFTFHFRPMAEARRIERLMAPRCPFKFMKPGGVKR